MKTIILETTNRLIMGILLLFSVFLLIRGHNLPGGGFSGGLVAASAFALQALSHGVASAREKLFFAPHTVIAIGLLIALLSGLPALAESQPFMTALWEKQVFPVIGKVGTPIVFDIGVYFVVLGIVSLLIFTLADQEEKWN